MDYERLQKIIQTEFPDGISNKDMIAWLEKQDKKISADKVIGWLVANICDFDYYVKRFKQDFGL